MFTLLLVLTNTLAQTPAEGLLQPKFGSAAKDHADQSVITARRQIATGHFREAIEGLQQAIDSDPNATPALKATRLGTLGIAFSQAGALSEALDVQHQALELFESLNNHGSASALLTNIGNTLSGLGDQQGAEHYYYDALELKKRHGITKGLSNIYNNLAEISEIKGDLTKASKELKLAIDYAQQQKDRFSESMSRSNLARILARLGHHTEALTNAQNAEFLAQEENYRIGILLAQAAHAQVIVHRSKEPLISDQQRKDELAKAEEILTSVLNSSRALGDSTRTIRFLNDLAQVQQLQNQPEHALNTLLEIKNLEDERKKQLDSTRADVLSARYEHKRQQREIERLRLNELDNASRIQHQRTIVFILAGLLLTALAAAIFLWNRNRLKRTSSDQLQQYNQALSSALDSAHFEQTRTKAYAMRQRRFLRLASEDIRGPLLEIRTLAERGLVETRPEQGRLSHAAIAQLASDLLWVSEQMVESASYDLIEQSTKPEREATDVSNMLQEIVNEATVRALHRDQHIELSLPDKTSTVYLERIRCSVALRELVDILIHLNPPRMRFHFSVTNAEDHVAIVLESGIARLPDWEDIALGKDEGDMTLRLALAWIQHSIQDNQGQIRTERDSTQQRRDIHIHFPTRPLASSL